MGPGAAYNIALLHFILITVVLWGSWAKREELAQGHPGNFYGRAGIQTWVVQLSKHYAILTLHLSQTLLFLILKIKQKTGPICQ